jgi:hypothetical protein
MTVELALLRSARPQLDPSREALAERLERLEAGVAGVAGGSGAGIAVSDAAPAEAAEGSPETSDRAPSMSSPAPPPPAPASETAEEAAPPVTDIEEAGDGGKAPAAVAVGEGVDLEKVRGLWPAVIDQVREGGSELLSHVLAAARPVAVNAEEAVLEVGFPASAAFNKRKAEAAEARDRFADALRTVVGESLRPVYVLLADEGEAQPEATLSEDELVELMRTEFDAEEYAEPDDGEAEAKEM